MGRLNLIESHKILEAYTPRASISPAALDLTECPYAWPFCQQAIYHDGMPLIFNATILNGMGVVGYVEGIPRWEPSNEEGKLLDLQMTFSDVIWPWTGEHPLARHGCPVRPVHLLLLSTSCSDPAFRLLATLSSFARVCVIPPGLASLWVVPDRIIRTIFLYFPFFHTALSSTAHFLCSFLASCALAPRLPQKPPSCLLFLLLSAPPP